MLTKEQIEFRKTGCGGSDMGDLFSIEPYGCERKLWYTKRGIKPDFDPGWDTNPNVLRGNALEPIIKAEFEKKYNVEITIPPQKRSKEYPFLLATTDGEYIKEAVKKVWESKAPTTDNFRRHVRLGLPEAYILQMQTYLYVMELEVGTFCLFSADMWQLLDFDIQRDDVLIAMIIEKAERFWKHVTEGPIIERLEQGDKRCKKCIYRLECWQELWLDDGQEEGVEDDYEELETEDFVEAFRVHEENKELVKEAEGFKEDSKQKLIDVIGNEREMVKCSLGKATYKWQKRTGFDKEGLKRDKPELVKEYSYEGGSLTLRIFPKKGI